MEPGWTGEVLAVAVGVASVLLAAAAVLVVVRLTRGPSVCDRAMALDLLGYLALGVVSVVVIDTGELVLFDAGMALAIVAFIATVALARFVEQGGESVMEAELVSGSREEAEEAGGG